MPGEILQAFFFSINKCYFFILVYFAVYLRILPRLS